MWPRSLPNGENCMDKLSDTDIDRPINGGACAGNGSSEQESGKREKKERVADKLIKIAVEKSYRDEASRPEAGGLFHTPDKVAYADIEAHGWRETWPVRSRGFRHWLVRVRAQQRGAANRAGASRSARLLRRTEARGLYAGRRQQRQDLHRPRERALAGDRDQLHRLAGARQQAGAGALPPRARHASAARAADRWFG